MHRLRTRTSKDEERDRQDDRAEHHERQAGFGRGSGATALGDAAAVVALLDRAGKDDDHDDADKDTHEGEADFASVETVGEEDDLRWVRVKSAQVRLVQSGQAVVYIIKDRKTYRVGKEECCSFAPRNPSVCVPMRELMTTR